MDAVRAACTGIAILVVGARFDAAYEIYAHIAVAERDGMTPERLAALVGDLKPNDLPKEENVAFDVAYKLVRGGTLREPLYRLTIGTFGQHGTNELIYLVGLPAAHSAAKRLPPSCTSRIANSDAHQ
jgi:4-carboxymuconolactone decarboxylase